MTTVAALYVCRTGPYFGLPDVDAWDVDRDARTYAGPWPVVAHPPCAQWGSLRHLARRNAAAAACGPRAVEQVRAFGGVLEQPKASKLWAFCGLPRPGELPDAWGGFAIEVEQVAWGHPCRKRTWLYVVGGDPATVFAGLRTGGEVTHWTSGTYTPGKRGTVPEGVKVIPPRLRHLTPPAFAVWLVEVARRCRR